MVAKSSCTLQVAQCEAAQLYRFPELALMTRRCTGTLQRAAVDEPCN